MEYVAITAAFAVFLWILSRRSQKKAPPPLRPTASEVQYQPKDRLAAALSGIRDAIRQDAESELDELRADIDAAQEAARLALDRVIELQLDDALLRVAFAMRYWPAWHENGQVGHIRESLVPGLEYLGGSDRHSDGFHERSTQVEFLYRSVRYRISIENERRGVVDGSYRFADLKLEHWLSDSYEVVFSGGIGQSRHHEFDDPWTLSSIGTLRLGEWTGPITALGELFRVRDERFRLIAERDLARSRAPRETE